MHRTSTTQLSDAMDRVVELNSSLDDVEWTPIESRINLVMMGSMLMQGIIDGTSPEEFTDEEYSLIETVVDRLNSAVEDMMLNNDNNTEWGC